jgi:tRNA A37 threonylcarbamoyltransferase TsaD
LILGIETSCDETAAAIATQDSRGTTMDPTGIDALRERHDLLDSDTGVRC